MPEKPTYEELQRRVAELEAQQQLLAEIASRKQAEEKYQTLFREMLDGFALHEILCDELGNPCDYRFLAVNPAFERITGLKAVNLVGQTVLKVLPDIERHWIETYGKVALTGEPAFFESYAAALDKHFQITVFRPEPHQFACIFADITERKRAEEALRESRQILEGILNAMPARVFWKDKNLVYCGCNAAFARDAGFTDPQDIIGKDDFQMGWRDQAELYRSDDRQVIESGHAKVLIEEPQTTPDGNTLTLLTSKIPLRGSTGEISGVLGIYLDITDRKRAEESLLETNEMFSLFMKHSPIYTYIKEVVPTESRVIQASDNFQQMIGISSREMKGKTMTDLFSAELAAKMTADDWSVVEKGEVLKLDEDLNGRNYTSIKFPIVRRGKTLLAGYTIDITERKQAEEELRQREELLHRLVENAPVSLAMFDLQMRYINASRRFLKENGLEGAYVHGKSYHELFPHYPERWRQAYLRVFAGETVREEEDFLQLADGSTSWFKWEALPWYDSTGQVAGLILFSEDITETKQAEEEKSKLQAQLQQAQKLESVGRLAGGVAHDFSNMLGVIIGHSEMALGQINPNLPLYDDLLEISKAAQRSADLTRQLLAFARRQTVAPRVLDLNATVTGMLRMLQRIIGEDIELRWNPGKELWPIKIDPSQIDQILANLCVNARDAIKGIGKVAIETENCTLDEIYCAAHTESVPGEYVKLSVSDSGCGMSKETLAQIFEPFFTTKGVGKGTGLGLATVYGAVKQNNGFINASSEPGNGSAFIIYLPRHAEKLTQTAGTEGAAITAKSGRETILLVEDEPSILKMTARALERQGYSVLTASTPREAIKIAREHSAGIQLLITDVILPEMNGHNLAENLQALHPRLNRMFMSGYPAEIVAQQGVLDEGIHFIQKPFLVQNLVAKVREALDKGKH